MKLKKKFKRILIIILLVILVGVGIGTYLILSENTKVAEVKTLKEIKEYGYVLRDNKSARYAKLFDKLEKILKENPVDEEKYVSLITEMFIVDFFSLNEKAAKTDVGGTDFVYKDDLNEFLENAEDTIYKYVESNIYKQRKQKLPEVGSVTIDKITQEKFKYLNQVDQKAYVVAASFKYKKNGDGYQDKATLIFIHNGKRLDLVQFK